MIEPIVSQIAPPLGFAVANATGGPVVYITGDPSTNVLTLTLTNQTGQPLALRGGPPVPEEEVTSSSPTSLYLTLGDLLDPSQLQALVVIAPGWEAQYFEGGVANWGLTPTSDLTLADQGAVTVTLTHLTVSGQPRPGRATVDYYNLPGLANNAIQQTVLAQAAPTGPQDLVLSAAIIGTDVVYVTTDPTSPIENTLVLSVGNPSPTTPVVPPDVPWGADPPVFYLSFATGNPPGYGALTTSDLAATAEVRSAERTPDVWQVDPVDQTGTPYWRLTPQQHEVLGVGTSSQVGFVISHLVTELEPEVLPTPLYLQWANIPGYNDGHTSLPLYKQLPTPGIVTFQPVSRSNISAGQPVVLRWQTFAVARVTLSYIVTVQVSGAAQQETISLDSAQGQINLNEASFTPTPNPLTRTTYALEAFDATGLKVATKTVSIGVADPPLTIEWFKVHPWIANFSDGPVNVNLVWSVQPSTIIRNLEIDSQSQRTDAIIYSVQQVSQPTTFTLSVTDLNGNLHTAQARIRELHNHLQNRLYLATWGPELGSDYRERWGLFSFEVLSLTEARFIADGGHVVNAPNPHQSDPGYPQETIGPWSLDQEVIVMNTTSIWGTVRLQFLATSAVGEALQFLNVVPFLDSTFWVDGALLALHST